MTRDEFIRTCQACGYASKETATAYANAHPTLTEQDYIEVYHAHDGNLANEGTWYSRMRDVGAFNSGKGKTSKRYE